MINVKDLEIGDFESEYRNNVQLQFNDDEKFISFLKQVCELGVDYQEKLKALNKSFTLDSLNNDFSEVTPQNTFILNSIGKLLNIPSIDYFNGIFQQQEWPNITNDDYVLILKGQIAKNGYNGTNINLIEILNSVFKGNFTFFLWDTTNMETTIYLLPTGTQLTDNIKYLFDNGYFTPKPAGVKMNYQTLEQATFTWDTDYTEATEDTPAMAQWDVGVWN